MLFCEEVEARREGEGRGLVGARGCAVGRRASRTDGRLLYHLRDYSGLGGSHGCITACGWKGRSGDGQGRRSSKKACIFCSVSTPYHQTIAPSMPSISAGSLVIKILSPYALPDVAALVPVGAVAPRLSPVDPEIRVWGRGKSGSRRDLMTVCQPTQTAFRLARGTALYYLDSLSSYPGPAPRPHPSRHGVR